MSEHELFRLDPAEFVAARDQLARELRARGEREVAVTVRGLRRPTVPAWALNQVSHAHPEEIEALADTTAAARSAQKQVLEGADRGTLRQALDQRRAAMRAVVHRAREVVEQSGRSADAQERELDAALLTIVDSPELMGTLRRGELTDVRVTDHSDDLSSLFAASIDAAPEQPKRAVGKPTKKGGRRLMLVEPEPEPELEPELEPEPEPAVAIPNTVPPALHVPRPDEGTAADEMTMLRGWLTHLRGSAIYKLEGLDDEQLRWKPTPTANSLGGIVMHLGHCEQLWVRIIFAAQTPERPIDTFAVPEGWTAADVVAFYEAEMGAADAVLDAAESLDQPSAAAVRPTTLRWVVTHLVEETARHVGHMDITRELVDGRTGR
ncbi:MAG: hypothetical protein QOH79_2100 [Acidimicrobiaceae bacterium]